MAKEAEEREALQEQLKAMEAKIMHGGEHVKDRVARMDEEIAERRKEVAFAS